jgi:hypothetical protein
LQTRDAIAPKRGRSSDFTAKYNVATPEQVTQFSAYLGEQTPSLKPLIKMYETIQHFFMFSYQAGGPPQAPQAQAMILGFLSNGLVDLLDGETFRLLFLTFLDEARKFDPETLSEDSVIILQNLEKACLRSLDEAWTAWESTNPALVESPVSPITAHRPGSSTLSLKGKYNTLGLLRSKKDKK